MNQRLLTLLEIALIIGLIAFVLYMGGIFNPPLLPTATLSPTQVQRNTVTPKPTLSVTHFPTSTPTFAPPTPTFPPRTTPTGLIAFDTTRDGNSEIYVMNADGSDQRNLTNNAADDTWASWSPDGKQIAFLSVRSGWQELYVMEADGSNVRQISRLAETNWAYLEPIRWSPDGQQIFVTRQQIWFSHTYTRPRLDLAQTDGSGTRTVFEGEAYIWQPSWLPGGQSVVVAINDDAHGTCKIQTASVADTLISFKPLLSFCRNFALSPDGSQIAVSNGYVYIYNLSDLTSTALSGTQSSDGNLFWSPNGDYIVYLTNTGPYYRGAYTDGSGALPFKVIFNSSAMNWAPDSQWLTYGDTRVQGGSNIFIFNLFDATPIQLTDTGNNYAPVWQPQP